MVWIIQIYWNEIESWSSWPKHPWDKCDNVKPEFLAACGHFVQGTSKRPKIITYESTIQFLALWILLDLNVYRCRWGQSSLWSSLDIRHSQCTSLGELLPVLKKCLLLIGIFKSLQGDHIDKISNMRILKSIKKIGSQIYWETWHYVESVDFDSSPREWILSM